MHFLAWHVACGSWEGSHAVDFCLLSLSVEFLGFSESDLEHTSSWTWKNPTLWIRSSLSYRVRLLWYWNPVLTCLHTSLGRPKFGVSKSDRANIALWWSLGVTCGMRPRTVSEFFLGSWEGSHAVGFCWSVKFFRFFLNPTWSTLPVVAEYEKNPYFGRVFHYLTEFAYFDIKTQLSHACKLAQGPKTFVGEILVLLNLTWSTPVAEHEKAYTLDVFLTVLQSSPILILKLRSHTLTC